MPRNPLSTAALVAAALLAAGCDLPRQETEVDVLDAVPELARAPTALGSEACRDAGYLCSGLANREEPRVLRWEESTPEIRIRIPTPPLESPGLARDLRDAAARGLLAWQNKPFPLRILRSDQPADADIVVRWTDTVGGTELGRARTEWSRSGDGRTTMRVTDFVLGVRDPFDRSRILEARQVRLTAAHEMGHALGLPHSDSERDVMFPTNTATSLSPRDYRTIAALYRLENGALLGPEALAGLR